MLGVNPGWVTSQGEILAEIFRGQGHRVALTSHHAAPLRRLLDIVTTLLGSARRLDVYVVMVFSGRGFLFADVATWIVRRLLRRPLVLCLRGGDLPRFASRHGRWVERVLARGDVLVAPSRYLAEAFAGRGHRLEVIPNTLDLARYPYRRRRAIAPRLLWMRTFHEIYQPALALEVLALLLRRHPAAVLTMAGQDAGLLDATRQRADELGIAAAVRFAGFLDPAGKAREMAHHDVFLNTNRVDNMPVSVVEAAACGLPVVATAVGGIPFLLRDGHDALLVPEGDAEAMAAAVERLLAEPELAERLSVAGRALAESCDGPAVAARWESLFAELAP